MATYREAIWAYKRRILFTPCCVFLTVVSFTGPICTSVADAAIVYSILAEPDPLYPYGR